MLQSLPNSTDTGEYLQASVSLDWALIVLVDFIGHIFEKFSLLDPDAAVSFPSRICLERRITNLMSLSF